MTRCDECEGEYEGAGTCPHCVRDIAHEYESTVNPAAGGDPLAIAGNLLIFLALLPMMLFLWSWAPLSGALASAGAACHVANRLRGRSPTRGV